MRKITCLIFCILFIASCSKDNDITPDNNTNSSSKIVSVEISVSNSPGSYWMNESDPLTLSVEIKDDKGRILTGYNGKVRYFANEKELASNVYAFEEEGNITFKAKVEGIESQATGNYKVVNPAKELDKLIITNTLYSKYSVVHTMAGSKMQISVKGEDKGGLEVPVKKGLKIFIGSENVIPGEYEFKTPGTLKISAKAYGKEIETTFEVRQKRNFELVRIPVVFHFLQPSPYTYPNGQTNAQVIETAIAQIISGDKLKQVNAMFRNQFIPNAGELDPNSSDSYIEFYLAEKDPKGNILKQPGINRMNMTRPYVSLNETYVYNESQRLYEVALEKELAAWKTNSYFNIVVENFGNWGYAGIAKMPMLDNNRKHLIPKEYDKLLVLNTNIEKLAWGNTNNRFFNDHVRINGANNVLVESVGANGALFPSSTLSHEIGHALGLQHTFGLNENCADHYHSDGLQDTPRQVSANYHTSCDGILFLQRNLMNYMNTANRGSFTYDQVTLMRTRIEAGFNLPTPRNKGNGFRENGEYNGHQFVIID